MTIWDIRAKLNASWTHRYSDVKASAAHDGSPMCPCGWNITAEYTFLWKNASEKYCLVLLLLVLLLILC